MSRNIARKIMGKRQWNVWRIKSANTEHWYHDLIGKTVIVKHFGTCSAYDTDDRWIDYYDLEYVGELSFWRRLCLEFLTWLKN